MPNSRMANAGTASLQRGPCGIIRIAALCPLCRYRHNIHWTKNESRLNRSFGQERWGDEGYALEELFAELGAAFTMAELGHKPEIREDHAPYIDHWLTVLKRDSRALLTVAAKASDALEYLCAFQPSSQSETAENREAA